MLLPRLFLGTAALTTTMIAFAQVGGPPPDDRQNIVLWPNPDFPTLQSAVDTLRDGGTLRIRPGRHVVREPVYIDKRLTIEGRGSCHRPIPDLNLAKLRSGALRGNVDLPGADGNGPPFLFETQSFLIGPPPTDIGGVEDAIGLVNLVGPHASVILNGLNMTGFDTAIFAHDEPGIPASSSLVVRDVCIANTSRGVTWLSSGPISMFDSSIRNTLWNGILLDSGSPVASNGGTLWGVDVQNAGAWCVYKKNGLLIAHDGLFAGCLAGGIYVEDGGLSVDDSVLGNLGGPGLAVLRSGAYFENNILWRTVVAGVFLRESGIANILDNIVDHTDSGSTGILGDGLTAIGSAQVVMDHNTIVDSARAGMSSFGSKIVLDTNTFMCQDFDIGSERFPYPNGDPAVFADLGGNLCGCPMDGIPMTVHCLAKSSVLEPPPPVGGLE